jgi:CubicO group peptidase (beta-lactamase class C family)
MTMRHRTAAALTTAALTVAALGLGTAAAPAPDPTPLEEGLAALTRCEEAVERRSAAEAGEWATRAEAGFAAALAADPAAADAHLGLAKTLLHCRIEDAPMMEKAVLLQRIEEHLGAVLAATPDHWEARFLYGALLYNVPPFLGRDEDAVRHLTAALELQETGRGPDLAEPYLYLGDLHRRGGREDEARAIWSRGRERHPGVEAFAERLQPAAPDAPDAPAATEGDSAAPGGGSATPEAALRRLVEAEVARPGVPGVAVAVARGGRPLLVAGFGHADVENRVPMTADSVCRIGSLSKQFTAVAFLRLAEDGAVGLDDPVARRLAPELAPALDGITFRHLLNHTAGLPRDPAEGADWLGGSLALPRVGEPGARYSYSNLGYAVLGRALEGVADEPFPELLGRRVLSPAGLEDTRLCDEREIVPRRAQGYGWRGDRLVNDDPMGGGPALLYAGGLCSTARDLLRWQRALHGGGLLSPASYAVLVAVPRVGDAAGTTYAAGLRVDAPRGRRTIHHSGGVSGFLSEVAYLPGDDLVVVVLTNGEASDPRRLGLDLADALLSPVG